MQMFSRFLLMFQFFHPISTTGILPFLLLTILNFRIYRRYVAFLGFLKIIWINLMIARKLSVIFLFLTKMQNWYQHYCRRSIIRVDERAIRWMVMKFYFILSFLQSHLLWVFYCTQEGCPSDKNPHLHCNYFLVPQLASSWNRIIWNLKVKIQVSISLLCHH